MNSLPEKLSDCLELALRDLELCEKSAEFKICMGTWFWKDNGVCVVCLSGSVMAQSLGYEGYTAHPDTFDSDVSVRLAALDALRCGDIGWAIGRVYDVNLDLILTVTPYSEDKKLWKADMVRVMERLKDVEESVLQARVCVRERVENGLVHQ